MAVNIKEATCNSPDDWGQLSECQDYGSPFDKRDDFTEIAFQDSRDTLQDHMHAAHAMFYTFDDEIMWNLFSKKGNVLMQMRFDGLLGFPGGLLDSVDGGQEDTIQGLNRELEEEAGLDTAKFGISQQDHVFSHVNKKKKLVLHFFAKEVSKGEFSQIEQGIMKAPDWGIETLGTIRVPLYIMPDGFRGLPVFLANRMCGNAKQQLLQTIAKRKILSKTELEEVLNAHNKYVKSVQNV